MYVDSSVLEILEFKKALAPFRERLAGELGGYVLDNLETARDFEQLKKRTALLTEWINLLDSGKESINLSANLQLVTPLLVFAKRSGVLSGEELLAVKALLYAADNVRDYLNNLNNQASAALSTLNFVKLENLENLRRRLKDFTPEIEALSVIEDSGRLADNASKKLFDIRSELDALKKNGRRTAQRIFEDSSILNMLQERSLSWRDGRFLMLVKQEYINRFPGLALERSGSGNSVYMEPRALSSINNSLMMKTRDERDEEHRILAELTRKILARDKAILEAEQVLGTIDLLNACYDLIRVKKSFIVPELVNRPEFILIGAKHPVLKNPVPVDVSAGKLFNELIITGPNTGGKTVVLKTVGVLVIMSWLGLPVPARDGTKVGAFDNIFIDIGDEQSVEQNLSTFSAHLKKIIYILKEARDIKALVLLDELGAGTDPQEGAALGVAVLETLRNTESITLATTHHNAIKQYALTTQNVETASMEFNSETLTPTYKLLMGVPGKSNALMIAKRYGMPENVLKLAKNVLDNNNNKSAENIMAELNERRAALNAAELKVKETLDEAERLKKAYGDRVAEIDYQRDKIMEAADIKAEKLLRRAEETMKAEMNGRGQKIKDIRGLIDKHHNKRVEHEIAKKPAEFKPEVGDTVQVAGSTIVGLIEAMDKNKAVLAAGPMHVEVPVNKLLPTEKKAKVAQPPANADALMRAESVPLSIMVRGMNVGEAMPLVETYLDRAYRAHYSSVTVIHGRGEGILRREVHALCERLLKKYVKSYRLGGEGEGGFGVTIVNFNN